MSEVDEIERDYRRMKAARKRGAGRAVEVADEELETGEPIPEEETPPPPKIPGRKVGFDGKPPARTADGTATGGQVVLASAKYMPQPTEDDAPPPRTRKPWHNDEPANRSDSFEGGVLNSGIGGGLLAMLVAVVWFVAGLMNDFIYFYPPILFVIGIFAVLNGLNKMARR